MMGTMARRIMTLLFIYGSIIFIAIVGMHYNVKSMQQHDEIIKLKLTLQSLKEERQQLQLQRNTMYSLQTIYSHAILNRMSPPKTMSFILEHDLSTQ